MDKCLTVTVNCSTDDAGAVDRVALADALHAAAGLILEGHDAGAVRCVDGSTTGIFAIYSGRHVDGT